MNLREALERLRLRRRALALDCDLDNDVGGTAGERM